MEKYIRYQRKYCLVFVLKVRYCKATSVQKVFDALPGYKGDLCFENYTFLLCLPELHQDQISVKLSKNNATTKNSLR